MRILLAEDDEISRTAVDAALSSWGYQVLSECDGAAAWHALQAPGAPRLILIDWQLPGLDGLEICRRIRNNPELAGVYVILLTSRQAKSDIIQGLGAGADDYVSKPFDREELRLRLKTGQRILALQASLGDRVAELEGALAQVRILRGILPICSYCKKVRKDKDYWEQVEAYISTQTDLRFSHGICPDCYDTRVKPELARLQRFIPPYPHEEPPP